MNRDKKILEAQSAILQALAGKINDFYLAGGTALSLFHFNHRFSDDLDFFTQEFNAIRVKNIVDILKTSLEGSIKLIGQNLSGRSVENMRYNFEFAEGEFVKIDFVLDVFPLIRPTKLEKGIYVLSAEDIYLRKIYAVSGLRAENDDVGRAEFIGGRQEAKDLFDIYYFSSEFMKLSDFVAEFCDQTLKEGVIRWFRTFPRTDMKAKLADEIKTDKIIEFKDIDKHLAEEIDKILEKEIDLQ